MGPEQWAMDMARHLVDRFALSSLNIYDFAYAIQGYVESLPDGDESP
jgi:hypothetical protein